MSAKRKLWESLAREDELILGSNKLYAYVYLDDLALYWSGGAWRRTDNDKTVGTLLVPTALMEWNDD